MTAALITEHIVSTGLNSQRYMVDASEIGLKPGEWPVNLDTTMGNRLPFVLSRVDEDENHIYEQMLGCIELVVLND